MGQVPPTELMRNYIHECLCRFRCVVRYEDRMHWCLIKSLLCISRHDLSIVGITDARMLVAAASSARSMHIYISSDSDNIDVCSHIPMPLHTPLETETICTDFVGFRAFASHFIIVFHEILNIKMSTHLIKATGYAPETKETHLSASIIQISLCAHNNNNNCLSFQFDRFVSS